MAEGDSPTVARRRVRMALREAREVKGATQLDVAEEMEWSLSKVIRIENGDVSIAPNDLRPLLSYLGIKDRAVVADLLADAKVARTRQRQAWYQSTEFREHLTDPLRRLIEYEAEATWIHSYSVFFIPGILQAPPYSRAIIEPWRGEITEDQIHYRLEARRLRHETVLSRAGSLKITALLDESVFMRAAGGSEVFAAQLDELVRMSEMGLLAIRMVPFSVKFPLSYNADFDLLFLGEDGDMTNAVMYRETATHDEIVEDPAPPRPGAISPPGTVTRHYDRYQKLWNASADEEDTIAFIRRRIQDLG
jgi:transcriptional regulator with XRE-family HTH domain